MTTSTYNENSIRVLTDEEKESYSATSMLEILIERYPSTSPEHLAKIAECLVSFKWGIDKYEQYRTNTLSEDDFSSMNAWFIERSRDRK